MVVQRGSVEMLEGMGRGTSGQASWHAEEVGPGGGKKPEMLCLSRESVWASLGGCCMAGSEHHQMSSHPGCYSCLAGIRRACSHAVFLQRPLLRRLNIMLTVKEKCLKEYHLLTTENIMEGS